MTVRFKSSDSADYANVDNYYDNDIFYPVQRDSKVEI